MLVRRSTIFLVLAFLGFSANAQSILGRAIVDGQPVLILSDGTWRYENSSYDECRLIALGLQFCGTSETWERITVPSPDITAAYRFDDLHYALIIAEGVGSDHGFDMETMRGITLEYAGSVSGGTASDVPVLDIFPAEIDEMMAETIVYLLEINDLKAVYANSILILPQRMFQFITYSIGSQFTNKHQKINADFLDNFLLE